MPSIKDEDNQKLYDDKYFSQGGSKGYFWGYFPEFKYLAKFLYQKFNPRTALDIGCAYGELVRRLVELGVDAYGVDISAYVISQGGSVIKRLKQIDIMSGKLQFQDNNFNLVTMLEVIEHIEDETNVLNEINRVLRQNGIAYITTPTPEAPPTDEHINIHDKDYWLDLFGRHGFEAETIKPLYSYTWDIAKDRSKEWMELSDSYKIKDRPKIMIKFVELLPWLIRSIIFLINGKYKKFKNDRITFRFLLRKKKSL